MPFTKIEEREARGDHLTLKEDRDLDWGCFRHDKAYQQHKDVETRNKADEELQKHAFKIYNNKDVPIGERHMAYLVGQFMKYKNLAGMGGGCLLCPQEPSYHYL